MAPKKKHKQNAMARRRAWNKGLEVGNKDAFTPDRVKRIRGLLAKRDISGIRDLALFSMAIDAMLRGRDLLGLLVRDVQKRNGSIRSTIEVSQKEAHQSAALCPSQQQGRSRIGLPTPVKRLATICFLVVAPRAVVR